MKDKTKLRLVTSDEIPSAIVEVPEALKPIEKLSQNWKEPTFSIQFTWKDKFFRVKLVNGEDLFKMGELLAEILRKNGIEVNVEMWDSTMDLQTEYDPETNRYYNPNFRNLYDEWKEEMKMRNNE